MAMTPSEFLMVVVLFVGPFLLIGGLVQAVILRRRGFRGSATAGLLLGAAVASFLLTWPLSFIVPELPFGGHGSAIMSGALVASCIVTAGLLAVFRKRTVLPNQRL